MSLQVELLEQSFEAIKPNANEFINSFYENLFTTNPEAKPLFENTDMEAQKQKLLSSLVLSCHAFDLLVMADEEKGRKGDWERS